MRVALINDTHFGGRGDSPIFSEYIGRFYEEVFFPYLKANDIDTIIHLGDIVDRRKYISYLSLRKFRDQLNIFGAHGDIARSTVRENATGVIVVLPLFIGIA